jgi:hypothetical protein
MARKYVPVPPGLPARVKGLNPKTQLVYLNAWTSKRRATEGLYDYPIAYMAHDLEISQQAARKAMKELNDRGCLRWDEENEVILLPEALSLTRPSSDLQCSGAVNTIADVPRSTPLLLEFYELVVDKNAQPFANALKQEFGEALSQLMANQMRDESSETSAMDENDAIRSRASDSDSGFEVGAMDSDSGSDSDEPGEAVEQEQIPLDARSLEDIQDLITRTPDDDALSLRGIQEHLQDRLIESPHLANEIGAVQGCVEAKLNGNLNPVSSGG